MKKIDILLLRAFIGPFIVTFFVALIVFDLQFLWRYMDDLIGKGLEIGIILKLFYYLSANTVPLALPLGVLVGSIITFGNLGEHYELVALKSSGISLQRFMMPLFVLSIFFSCIAFLFSNTITPYTNLKFRQILSSISLKKPALNIQEGLIYREIDGYNILVGKKEADNQTIRDIKIWDKTRSQVSNSNVLAAQKGFMSVTPNQKYLIFKLFDGVQYEEMKHDDPKERTKNQHMRTYFSEYELAMSLGAFGFSETSEDRYKTNPKVLGIAELNIAIDSLEIREKTIPKQTIQQSQGVFGFINDTTFTTAPQNFDTQEWLQCLPLLNPIKRQKVFEQAIDKSKTMYKNAQWAQARYEASQSKIVLFYLAWYEKFAIAFSCILFYLVGASMGAIIRKGGIGLPMVVGILFFMTYFVLTTSGKKMAEESAISAFTGTWLPTYVLLPIALFLLYHAINDSEILTLDGYKRFFNRVLIKIKK